MTVARSQAHVRQPNHGLALTLVLAMAAPLVLFVGALAAFQINVARKPLTRGALAEASGPPTHHIGFDLYQSN